MSRFSPFPMNHPQYQVRFSGFVAKAGGRALLPALQSQQRVTCAYDHILIPIQFIRDRAIPDAPPKLACHSALPVRASSATKLFEPSPVNTRLPAVLNTLNANRHPPICGSNEFCPSCNQWPASSLPAIRHDLCRPNLADCRRGRKCNRC